MINDTFCVLLQKVSQKSHFRPIFGFFSLFPVFCFIFSLSDTSFHRRNVCCSIASCLPIFVRILSSSLLSTMNRSAFSESRSTCTVGTPFTFPLRAGNRWFRAYWVISIVQVEVDYLGGRIDVHPCRYSSLCFL